MHAMWTVDARPERKTRKPSALFIIDTARRTCCNRRARTFWWENKIFRNRTRERLIFFSDRWNFPWWWSSSCNRHQSEPKSAVSSSSENVSKIFPRRPSKAIRLFQDFFPSSASAQIRVKLIFSFSISPSRNSQPTHWHPTAHCHFMKPPYRHTTPFTHTDVRCSAACCLFSDGTFFPFGKRQSTKPLRIIKNSGWRKSVFIISSRGKVLSGGKCARTDWWRSRERWNFFPHINFL